MKILVDDQEPRVRAVWEKELRKRMADASEIFDHYCRVRFRVVAVDTWIADAGIHDFNQSVAEFGARFSLLPRESPSVLPAGTNGCRAKSTWAEPVARCVRTS